MASTRLDCSVNLNSVGFRQEELTTFLPVIKPRSTGSLTVLPDEEMTSTFEVETDQTIIGLSSQFELFQKRVRRQAERRIDDIHSLEHAITGELDRLEEEGCGSVKRMELWNFVKNALCLYYVEKEPYFDEPAPTDDALEAVDTGNREFSFTELIDQYWLQLSARISAKEDRFKTARMLDQFYRTVQDINKWIVDNYNLLLSTDDLGTDLNSLVQLQRRIAGWEADMKALDTRLDELRTETEILMSGLKEEVPKRRDLQLSSTEWATIEEVRRIISVLERNRNELEKALSERQEKLLVSTELQQFLQVSFISTLINFRKLHTCFFTVSSAKFMSTQSNVRLNFIDQK